ncbi:helix-turn-helix domain-containing protein [Paenibacillus xylanilyticus]|uniref:Helix-turn-helix transcriptional regulator n=1 Tax=Paenibacillus xylanilyticus TaxID=248903 RepID=A0A7Y6BS20_9BACL|nr:helix-turn-helix transcriptional regulator [Paenibacillus xylanilyticus]NUU73977.1 helix-turn-helix transcriptional regulator [Paenibacillus xylanilyticus]
MDLKEFGVYFAKIRERSGYRSQRELAEKSGVSHSTINRIESGSHKVSTENLKILAPHLKEVTYEDLLHALGYIDNGATAENTGVETTIRMLEKEAHELGLSISDPQFIEMVKDSIKLIKIARGKDLNNS